MDMQYPALVTDYDVEWIDAPALPEGTRHEHGYIHLGNGYTISVLRSNVVYDTVGYAEGMWEAVVGKPAGDLAKMLGLDYEPAPELEHLLNADHGGVKVAGPLDSPGVTQLAATVAELPSIVKENV